MSNKRISNFEYGTLNYFITRAFIVGTTFNAILSVMKRDLWIIPILSIIIDILFIFIINKIINYEPDLNLPQKILKLFGNLWGKIIIIFISIFALLINTLTCLTLNNFVQSQFLNKTPLLFIGIIFAITIFYILIKGINVIARTSVILFYINMFLFIVSLLGLIPTLNFSRLQPLFQFNPTNFLSGINIYYAFHITPMFILTMIPKNKIENPKIKKTLIISSLISTLAIFLIFFITISSLGYQLSVLYEYPEFHVLKQAIFIGTYSRIESILAIQFLLDIFVYSTLVVYLIGTSLKEVFKINNKNIIYIVSLILLKIGAMYAARFNVLLDNLVHKIIPLITTLFVSLIIFLIFFKVKKKR